MSTSAPTRLRQFMASSKLDTARAAKLFACSRAYVSLLQNGHRRPSLELAAQIERVTSRWAEGPIFAADWVQARQTRKRAAA